MPPKKKTGRRINQSTGAPISHKAPLELTREAARLEEELLLLQANNVLEEAELSYEETDWGGWEIPTLKVSFGVPEEILAVSAGAAGSAFGTAWNKRSPWIYEGDSAMARLAESCWIADRYASGRPRWVWTLAGAPQVPSHWVDQGLGLCYQTSSSEEG